MAEDLPPPGTPVATILTQYPGAIRIGLYQGYPSKCPPAAYATIVQPVFPSYTLLAPQEYLALPAPAGSGLAASRFQARWVLPAGSAPVAVNGWFAAALLSDSTYQTVMLQPFANVVSLTAAAPLLQVSVQASAAPTGLAGGQDVVATAGQLTQGTFGDGKMKLYRGEQRRCMQTVIAGLNQLLAWDGNYGNLKPSSRLNRDGILAPLGLIPGTVTVPPNEITFSVAARDVATSLTSELSLNQ